MKQAVLNYVNRDRVHFAAILAALDDPSAQVLYAADDGLAVDDSGLLFLSAGTEPAVHKLVSLFKAGPTLSGYGDLLIHEDRLLAPLCACGFRADMCCFPCLYEPDTPPAAAPPAGMSIRLLDHSFDEAVRRHYRDGSQDKDYIRTRIDAGMLGIFEDDALAGFIGAHDGGEMGLLEILPAYRRRGCAYSLEAAMIARQLSLGRLAHAEVETWNEPSLLLQRRLGMSVSSRSVTWLSRA